MFFLRQSFAQHSHEVIYGIKLKYSSCFLLFFSQAYEVHLQSSGHAQNVLLDSLVGGDGDSNNSPEKKPKANVYTCTICNIDMGTESVSRQN